MATLESPDSGTKTLKWVDRVGFIRGDPFEFNEAGQERALLPEFFVEFDNFERIRAQKTAIVFAPRGGGKSAMRVYLANSACPITPESPVLAIEYTDFDAILWARREKKPLSAEDHVSEIMAIGANALFESFCGKDESDALAERGRRSARLSPPIRARLAQLFARYCPERLTAEEIYERWQQLDPSFAPAWLEYRQYYQSKQLHDLIKEFPSLEGHPIARLLADLRDFSEASEQAAPDTAVKMMASFVETAARAGFREVWVLVDGIDENHITANDPEAQADILEPLLGLLPLLEHEQAAFKFFLSREARERLLSREAIRQDRLHDQFVSVGWEAGKLKRLLQHRLSVYSEARIRDLTMLFSKTKDGQAIESEMLRLAQGSPRRLLVAGRLLFGACQQREGGDDLLTIQDWKTAKQALLAKMPPPLKLFDGKNTAMLRGEEIRFSKQEHRIMQCLAETAGICDRETLVNAVWGAGEGVSEEAIDAAIGRLRKKFGDEAVAPLYLKTVKGVGFELMNYEVF